MAFYDSLHAFLKGDGVTFEKDVVFSNYSTIDSSVYHAFFIPLPTAPDEVRRPGGPWPQIHRFTGIDSSIAVLRCAALCKSQVSLPPQVTAMKSVRDMAANAAPNFNAFAYADPFLFYEGFAVIQRDTLQAVLIAGALVFVICLVMLGDLVSA